MNLASLGTIVLVNLVGALSPGPDIILITRTATKSRRHAMAVVAGINLGVLFWVTLTVVGAAALLHAFPWVLEFVQVLGGGWILWLGISMVRSWWTERYNVPTTLSDAEARLGRLRHSCLTGLTTNLSNPKIVLFLAALVAPLLPPSPSVGIAATVIIAMVASTLLLHTAISLVISTNKVRLALLRAGPLIDLGSGLFFIVAAVLLIYRGVTGLL